MALLTVSKQRLNPETDCWENYIPALGAWIKNADNREVQNVRIVGFPNIHSDNSPNPANNRKERNG